MKNKIHRSLFLLVLVFIFSSCTHRLTRSGYKYNQSVVRNNQPVLTRSSAGVDSLENVGQLKLGEASHGYKCLETEALEIIKKEARLVAADIILIKDEKRPDFVSSCYRCTAVFYKNRSGSVNLKEDPFYTSENIAARRKRDKRHNLIMTTAAIVVGGAGGIILGYYMYH